MERVKQFLICFQTLIIYTFSVGVGASLKFDGRVIYLYFHDGFIILWFTAWRRVEDQWVQGDQEMRLSVYVG
jgi:hypothetical protein